MNSALTYLDCWNNQLTNLDVSTNDALLGLACYENQLTCLNVANGNNSNFLYLEAFANPNLSCIEVDDTSWSTENGISIDSQTSFSENCNNDCSSSTAGITEPSTSKNLINILDLMSRETSFKPNTPLMYVYDDGSTERIFKIEE